MYSFGFNLSKLRYVAFVTILTLGSSSLAIAQDLLGDTIGFSGSTLNLKRYVDPGANKIISMTAQPSNTGNRDLFVTTQEGFVYSVADDGTGAGTSSLWFNYNTAINDAVTNANNGFVLDQNSGQHGGLRAVAFHPEFASNGKFYTSAQVDRPSGVSGLNYLGQQLANPAAESLLAEWTFDFNSNQVDNSSYRELFRVQMPIFDHPIKQIAFNNHAQPGDEDYGLLYITHGDGSNQSATAGDGQSGNDALGKVLRINPLESGGNPYTTPNSPFAGDGSTLDEIYTLGHRNPHHISFAVDGNGDSHPIVAEGGRDNIEEVNLLLPGANYGWAEREGTFVHNTGGGYGLGIGVSNLPSNEWEFDFTYPSAQYDHDANPGQGFVGSIIAGGFVLDHVDDPNLVGEYIFADFGSKSGNVYQASFDELVAAKTQLNDFEAPSALTQAPISRLMLTLDNDGDGTIDVTADNLNTLLSQSRNDVRFGRGPRGEMFISSKRTGVVYLVTGTGFSEELTLTVDRSTGEVSISNMGGIGTDIDGIRIESASGSLSVADFSPIDGNWSLSASNSSTNLVQLNEDGVTSFADATPVGVGNVYDPQLLGFGQGFAQDLVFTYTGPNGEEAVVGQVAYVGEFDESAVPNTIVLTVDVTTGEASMVNPTQFSQELEAYTITSESGSLDVAGWETFESNNVDDGTWSAAPGDANRILEVQEDGTTTFDDATHYNIGEVLADGATQDLQLEFLLAGDVDPLLGIVQYILAGDYNDDGTVDSEDYTVWRDNLGSDVTLPNDLTPGIVSIEDYDTWASRFGATLLAASVTEASVPEPTSAAALLLSLLALGVTRARRS